MVFKRQRKGQAAIEFLMTYGWMLLVVLIVGALIFSFVDFGSLLPNKLELSNNLKGDPTISGAFSKDNSLYPNLVQVVFRYNGAKRALIGISNAEIRNDLGDVCNATKLENLDTKNIVSLNSTATTTAFLNGHDGLMTFDCSNIDSGNGLLSGDNLQGVISIPVEDPKTGLKIPSTGSIRIQINQ